jgi:hypothetical protein
MVEEPVPDELQPDTVPRPEVASPAPTGEWDHLLNGPADEPAPGKWDHLLDEGVEQSSGPELVPEELVEQDAA